ncbi:hypothetical protein BKA56DRAFT_705105 [Ilyonectria sp. MPI-CAGE-AT-0026]|nr:hypothetical protein BKA56DRAFT_705105 [Ilyonectria sp. MPI-CAGE-AT-0026]
MMVDRLFAHIHLAGHVDTIRDTLHEFISGQRFFNIKDVRQCVREATITIAPPRIAEADEWVASIENSRRGRPRSNHDELARNLVSCVLAMNDLHTLSLNLGGVTRALEPHIIDAIHKDRKWNIASLRFFAPYSNIPKTILEHYQNNTLESLHVYTGESSSEIETAAEYHPGLKRLHLSVLPNTGTMIASMDFARWKSLSTKFLDLEWLALDEKLSLQRYTPGGYSAVQFRKEQRGLARGLLRLKKLKRVAFTVHKEGFERKLIENNDRHHGEPEQLTPFEQNRWYRKVICKLAGDCPNLEEICVMVEFPEFYRETRGQDGQAMVVRRRTVYQISPKDGFSVGLMEGDSADERYGYGRWLQYAA